MRLRPQHAMRFIGAELGFGSKGILQKTSLVKRSIIEPEEWIGFVKHEGSETDNLVSLVKDTLAMSASGNTTCYQRHLLPIS
jgi:hypothetical protein